MANKKKASAGNTTTTSQQQPTTTTNEKTTTEKSPEQQQQAQATSSTREQPKNIPYTVNGRSRFFFMYPTFSVAPFIQSIVNAIQGTDNKGEKVRTVVIGGQGKAIPRVVNIAEIVKRRIVGLHQTSELFTREVATEATDSRPAQDFKIACLAITLSLDEPEKKGLGYQAPLPIEKVCAQDDEKMMHEILKSGSHITTALQPNNNNNNSSNSNNNNNRTMMNVNSSGNNSKNNNNNNRGGNNNNNNNNQQKNNSTNNKPNAASSSTAPPYNSATANMMQQQRRGGNNNAPMSYYNHQVAAAAGYPAYPPVNLQWIGQPPPLHVQQQIFLQHQQMAAMNQQMFGTNNIQHPSHQQYHPTAVHTNQVNRGVTHNNNNKNSNRNNNQQNNNTNSKKNVAEKVLSSKIGDATTAEFVPKFLKTSTSEEEQKKTGDESKK